MKGYFKKMLVCGIIFLFLGAGVIPIIKSTDMKICKNKIIEKNENEFTNDDYCWLGSWELNWEHPLRHLIPVLKYNIDDPLVCKFPEIDGKVTLKFKINCSTYFITRPLLPRVSLFHHSIYYPDNTPIMNEDLSEMEIIYCVDENPTVRVHTLPEVTIPTNGQNVSVNFFLTGMGFPFGWLLLIQNKNFTMTIVPIPQ